MFGGKAPDALPEPCHFFRVRLRHHRSFKIIAAASDTARRGRLLAGVILRAFILRIIIAAAFAGTAAVSLPGDEAAPVSAAGDCTVVNTLDSEETAFLALINQHRADNGRQPLAASYFLSRAAQWKSNDMGANAYFGHDDQFRPWYQRVQDCGYTFGTAIGENIAAGMSTAQSAFNAWKNSPGHNSNMLSTSYTAIGIGRAYVADSPYGWYWTTVFGGVNDGWMVAAGQPAPVDNDPPTVAITRAERGQRLTVQASDASGIAHVDLLVNGKLRRRDALAPYVFDVPRSRLLTELVVTDGAGNQETVIIPRRR